MAKHCGDGSYWLIDVFSILESSSIDMDVGLSVLFVPWGRWVPQSASSCFKRCCESKIAVHIVDDLWCNGLSLLFILRTVRGKRRRREVPQYIACHCAELGVGCLASCSGVLYSFHRAAEQTGSQSHSRFCPDCNDCSVPLQHAFVIDCYALLVNSHRIHESAGCTASVPYIPMRSLQLPLHRQLLHQIPNAGERASWGNRDTRRPRNTRDSLANVVMAFGGPQNRVLVVRGGEYKAWEYAKRTVQRVRNCCRNEGWN